MDAGGEKRSFILCRGGDLRVGALLGKSKTQTMVGFGDRTIWGMGGIGGVGGSWRFHGGQANKVDVGTGYSVPLTEYVPEKSGGSGWRDV